MHSDEKIPYMRLAEADKALSRTELVERKESKRKNVTLKLTKDGSPPNIYMMWRTNMINQMKADGSTLIFKEM